MIAVNQANRQRVRDPLLLSCFVFVLAVATVALLAPWISPYSASGLEEKQILETPSWSH
jgi:ABC-type antimicrobial peptide transport system permease subunit